MDCLHKLSLHTACIHQNINGLAVQSVSAKIEEVLTRFFPLYNMVVSMLAFKHNKRAFKDHILKLLMCLTKQHMAVIR